MKYILQEHPESGHMEGKFFLKPGFSENTFVLILHMMITWLGQNLKLFSFLFSPQNSSISPAFQAATKTSEALLIAGPQYVTFFCFSHNPSSF